MIPLSLYIHLPWCVRKCPYCDFNSHEVRGDNLPEELYVAALLKDLDEHLTDRPLVSIFFGGGTPSLFSPNAIETLLTGVHKRLRLTSDIEITLEANPGTVDEARFKGFRQAGVNRLSIGVQSLQDEKLKALGRIHNRDYALRAIDAAKNAGFDNFNLDFMHGLPNQSISDALSDLKDALAYEPPHLSWYQLTLEPNTVFYKKPPTLPVEDVLFDIQDQGIDLLQKNNFIQYEVSAFSKSNRECLHNKNYWEFGDYLGIGAGAHSKITHQNLITRHWCTKQPLDYINPEKKFIAGEKVLTQEDIQFEFMLNALRLIQGVPATLFTERTGLSLNTIETILSKARAKKLLQEDKTIIAATPLGQRFLNELIGMFLT